LVFKAFSTLKIEAKLLIVGKTGARKFLKAQGMAFFKIDFRQAVVAIAKLPYPACVCTSLRIPKPWRRSVVHQS
jgi:hypothetical protein